MTGNNLAQRAYNVAASQMAQANFNATANLLESLIEQRDADVKAAMAEYQADGVSDEYAEKEQRWRQTADSVKAVIGTLRAALEKNDETASSTLQQARGHVLNV